MEEKDRSTEKPSTSTSLPTTASNVNSNSGNLNEIKEKTEKTVIGRFYSPPTLERKESCGDLHSRLKTRKMLGVGETDNGDIHRSKISQVLGHNEHLYLKLPRGYWNWHLFLTIFFAIQGILILLFPIRATELGLLGISTPTTQNSGNSDSNSAQDPVEQHQEKNMIISSPMGSHQYYAAIMLALSSIFWRFLDTNDKAVARTLQNSILIYFGSLLILDLLFVLTNGISLLFQKSAFLMLSSRIGICFISVSYLKAMGRATSGLRRSPSYKDPPADIGARNSFGRGTGSGSGSGSSTEKNKNN